jgi:hypothetical protein
LIGDGHNVSGRGSRPSSDTTTGRHVRKVRITCDDVGNVEQIVVRSLRCIGVEPILVVEVCQLQITIVDAWIPVAPPNKSE